MSSAYSPLLALAALDAVALGLQVHSMRSMNSIIPALALALDAETFSMLLDANWLAARHILKHGQFSLASAPARCGCYTNTIPYSIAYNIRETLRYVYK